MVSVDDIKDLQDEVVADLSVTMSKDTDFDEAALAIKAKNAIMDVVMRRNYIATSFSKERILADLRNYYNTICRLTEYDYNQIGAEGQSSHSENETDRVWVSRDEILSGVHAFVQVF